VTTSVSAAILTDDSCNMHVLLGYAWTEALTVAIGEQYLHGNRFDEYWYYPGAGFLRADMFC